MKISYEEELKITERLLSACGMPEEDAALAAKVIAHSDFTGVYSHGMSRLTLYLKLFRSGAYNPRPNISVLKDEGTMLCLDCDNALGAVSVNKAFDMLLPKLRENAVAVCVGKQSTNIGCGAYYGLRAAENDVICLLCCNTYLAMAPFGGADKLLGTNPIVVGVPAGVHPPIIMDVSTSGVAFGKIQAYARENKALPQGWANDINGSPTTDARKAYTVLPIAAHKGYGLAVIVDILSAVLSGACFGSNIGAVEALEPEGTGFFMLLIDPAKFMPMSEFKERVDSYISMMKNSRRADGVDEIFMPGEIEYRLFKKNRANGIELSGALESDLRALAAELGLLSSGEGLERLL